MTIRTPQDVLPILHHDGGFFFFLEKNQVNRILKIYHSGLSRLVASREESPKKGPSKKGEGVIAEGGGKRVRKRKKERRNKDESNVAMIFTAYMASVERASVYMSSPANEPQY